MINFLDLKYTNNDLRKMFQDKLNNIINTNEYILGEEVNKFEKNLSQYIGTNFALGVSNGLDAITLALRALDIKEGDEVIVPSNTFIATWIAVSRVKAKPIPVEFDVNTYNINPMLIEDKITNKTKAIIAVHLYGLPADMDNINYIAKKYNLKVIEDCAQAFGADYKNKKIGSLSDIAAFSFFPTKNFGALGDAGGITTNSKEYYKKIKLLRNYGSSKKYIHEEIGYNARLDSLQAGFLNIKFNYIDNWNNQRQIIAKKYLGQINNNKIILPKYGYKDSVWHLFVILVEDRDRFQQYLLNNNIETLIHYPIPPHLQKAYISLEHDNLIKTESIAKGLVSIPIYPGLNDEDISKVINTINNYGEK